MSKQSQQKFLERFDNLLKERAGVYRQARANKVSHVFVISKKAIERGIKDTIAKNGTVQDTKEILSLLNTDIQTFVSTIIRKIDALEAQSRGDNVKVRIRKLKPGPYNARYIFFASKKDQSMLANVYGKIYKTYIEELGELATKVGGATQQISGKNLGNNAKKYWNLEHAEEQGNVESQVADALTSSLQGLDDMPRAEVMAWLEKQGVELKIIRNTKTKVMEVHIGSKYGNMEEGIISRGRKKVLRDAVSQGLLDQANDIYELPGSDSFKQIDRKQVIATTTKPFKRIKGAKITTEDTAIKHSVTTVTSKKTSSTVKKGKTSKVRAKPAVRTKKGVASSPLQLIALINKDLPKVVQENMGPPRLVNRTGRFASSARVVNITKTPEGFPSVAYTYQRNPYQVFEEGSKGAWSSRDRDPRRLIDQSIREIAAKYAIGRFYTRRV